MITTSNMPVSGTSHSFLPSFRVLVCIVSLCIASWCSVTQEEPAEPMLQATFVFDALIRGSVSLLTAFLGVFVLVKNGGQA
jgi:hypothetical protein